MTTLTDVLTHPSIAALGWTLIHFLWQGAVLGGAAFLILRAVRPQRAVTRYAIGVVTLALMLMACVSTFVVLARQPAVPTPAEPAAFAIAPAAAAHTLIADAAVLPPPQVANGASWQLESLDTTTLLLIVLAWSMGVLIMTLRLIGGWVLARRLVTRASTTVSPAINAAARAIAAKLNIRRAVAICESQWVAVPTLVGWLKPVVLLPAAALSGLTPDQLQAILAHELAHVRRHDYLVNLLQSMVETLLFYHPATWWVSAQIRAEREHCCDDLAVDVCGDRLVYASALAELTSMAGHQRLALAATDGSLLNRVRRILGSQRSMHEPAPAAWPLLALVVIVMGAGSFRAGAIEGIAEVPTEARAITQDATTAPTAPPVELAEQFDRAHRAEEQRRAQAEAEQAAEIVQQLRAQAEWLNAEAARLREEADRIRRTEANLGGATWSSGWFSDWFGTAQPQPPQPPEPPTPPTPPTPPEPPMAEAFVPPSPPAPPARPAPPTPPAPPAPPAPPQDSVSVGSGNMTWSNNGDKISMKWTGAFRLSEDETDIGWIEEGKTVTISDGRPFGSRVELRGTATGVERSWRKGSNGSESDGRKFLADAIDKIIRHTGMFAKERVARHLERGGPDAVLAQIDRLADSSYVKRVYYSELLEQAPSSDALLTTVLQRVPNEIRSDYDKSTLLTLVAKQPAMNDSHRVAIARAVGSIQSDYDQRRALTAILNTRPLAPAVAAAVIDATSSIGSNYDRAQVLVMVVESGGLTPATAAAFMQHVRTMSSSYDQRRVLTAVAAHGSLDGVGVEAIRATESMSSNYDLATTLIALAERGALTDASSQAFFESASKISSSHELSRVLRKVLDRPAVSEPIMLQVLRAAPRVGSSHDRANVLVGAAARGPLSAEARQLYVAAGSGLGSHDENRTLAALVRAETRR